MTDLTATTWQISSGWTVDAELGKFNINGILDFPNIPTRNFTTLCLGYNGNTAEANKISLDSSDIVFSNTEKIYITIIDGSDVTNTSLITWLTSKGRVINEGLNIVVINNSVGTKLFTKNKMMQSDIDIIPILQEKTINKNGEITMDNGYLGLSRVIVDIPVYNGEIEVIQ